jgi:protein-tyrosine phosphatase
MRHMVAERNQEHLFEIDSAGTAAYHAGEPPDRRATAAAKKRGIVLSGWARQFRPADFDRFDWVLAMDSDNFEDLTAIKPAGSGAKLHLFREFDPSAPPGAGVPDPYYGGARGFDEVLDICERACAAWLDAIAEA